MSINWVMLTPPTQNTTTTPATPTIPAAKTPFVLLPSESILHTTPPRTSLALSTPSTYPGKTPFSISSPSGTCYLTNRRIVYLPAAPTPALSSFAGPLTHIHDSRVTTPWLGPNVWVAAMQAVPGGGLPAGVAGVEARLTFKEGGAYDFHTKFCHVKERLAQVMEARAMSGASGASLGDVVGSGQEVEDVHLEQLPAYEEGSGFLQPPPGSPPSQQEQAHVMTEDGAPTCTDMQRQEAPASTTVMLAPTPAEPPPGYEVAQRDSVANQLENGLRFRHGGGHQRGNGEED